MAAIDIGDEPTDRASNDPPGYTMVPKGNPANDTGTIDTVELWVNQPGTFEVATFYVVAGTNLTTRASASLGALGGSYNIITGLSLAVQTGDYLGYHSADGSLDRGATGGLGTLYKAGDYIPCTNAAFTDTADYVTSLKGTGSTPGTSNLKSLVSVGQASIKSVCGVAEASIKTVCGVAD
jgi:hypothetical protein